MWPWRHNLTNMLRIIFSIALAFVVTSALFLLMHRLVNHESPALSQRVAPVQVDIRQVKETPKPQEKQVSPESKPAPAMESLSVAAPNVSSLVVPNVAAVSDIAISTPQWQSKEMAIEQRYWSAPAGSGGTGDGLAAADYIGEADTGRREIVPMATRRPNIPKLAYDNQINGWVLLVFTVANDGKVKNIRILDAEPRGVFEANAIAAVRGWIYNPYKGPERHISQRIQFDWNMYSYNMDFD